MNIYKTELFPYVEGDSLKGKTVTLTMATVNVEKLKNNRGQEEKKYVVYFDESQKGLVLNKTNAKIISRLYGPETNAWTGQRITLYAEEIRAF